MKTLSADVIFPANGPAIKNGYITIGEQGVIQNIGSTETARIRVDQHFEGALCPGFVNAHCHLELSFMFEKIPTHTGLIDFIKHVIAIRDQFDEETQLRLIAWGEEQMVANGIVAVGDISNDTRSFAIKEKSQLRFHTFVEVFDFGPSGTEEAVVKGKTVFKAAPKANGNTASITPHAPYSCTPTLVNFCDRFSSRFTPLLSIHNQEHPEENQYFIDKTGAWNDLFASWQQKNEWFVPVGKSSMQAMAECITERNQILYIHNTFTSAEDVAWAQDNLREVYYCSCPNANLYIENRLPNYDQLVNAGAKLCLGTDSLASNWQYSILEEMKVVQSHHPQFNTEQLVEWACWNGAKALFFDQDLGSLEVGKQPGIVHISHLGAHFALTENSQATRIDV